MPSVSTVAVWCRIPSHPLVAKRVEYKRRAKALEKDDPLREVYRRRQSAHKWLLVTCFGYLGTRMRALARLRHTNR